MAAELQDPEKLYALVTEAAGGLRFADDVHALVKAAIPNRADLLYNIAFRAKFVVRTRKIIERLPPHDDAREQLKGTFQNELETLKRMMLDLTGSFPEDVTARFRRNYFSATIESFGALMELLHDLSWIQNVRLDEGNA